MKTADFDYCLPSELVAQTPVARREESRLLVVHRDSRQLEHRTFRELPDYLHAGDVLVRNTARVLPARLFGERSSGGRVECLLLRPAADSEIGPASSKPATAEAIKSWWCLLPPGTRKGSDQNTWFLRFSAQARHPDYS